MGVHALGITLLDFGQKPGTHRWLPRKGEGSGAFGTPLQLIDPARRPTVASASIRGNFFHTHDFCSDLISGIGGRLVQAGLLSTWFIYGTYAPSLNTGTHALTLRVAASATSLAKPRAMSSLPEPHDCSSAARSDC